VNVVDSSAWLEYFANGPNAGFFAEAIEQTEKLLVPAIVLYEVFKRIRLQRGENAALQAVAVMQEGEIVPLDAALALHAAQLGIEHRLPLADSTILATARDRSALLWTQDSDFQGLEGVRYRPHDSSS